ncbi:glycoside hydrolase 100 family protein [Altibacter sp. HG106]|uniref:glycoside hydrolase 100 family protein n=1 Tax=Altibacter sp. HG106 TaxID=3023937 RepID=UPI00234FD76D|nr:glycoside hydrolase 100 family protein [Altibacter sp. HG106]MDC7994251.1 glycoside hydrolase 100 family protein [Altibacter sp. HG106]
MRVSIATLLPKATELLFDLLTPHGFLASTQKSDNYKRIWARDSVVCGLAGVLLNEDRLLDGLHRSLRTLGDRQHDLGMIPSNVAPEEDTVSYGSLVGRIDTASWWILGACFYYKHSSDDDFWDYAQPIIKKARTFLQASEFNGKGWIYTPLSGNWADEYPVHGYTLYDNVLRLWAEQIWSELSNKKNSYESITERTRQNFWPLPEMESHHAYQRVPFETLQQQELSHFVSFILPGIYDQRFDAAGNSLAMLLYSLSEAQKRGVSKGLTNFKKELGTTLIPAFWPIITETSEDYFLLKGNYSYAFKNRAGHFHNGGIWPVWMGLFCLGLARQKMHDDLSEIVTSFENTLENQPRWNFHEYLDAKTLAPGGTPSLGYTASGIVFMHAALNDNYL